jgi:hypothetical protein
MAEESANAAEIIAAWTARTAAQKALNAAQKT